MGYPVLKSSDTDNLSRKSSISQHGGMLSVLKAGEWCPLVADAIEAVDCHGNIIAHKVAITDKPVVGYTFPVKGCRYASDLYLLGQRDEVTIERLPEWFGIGFYKKHTNQNVFLNAENGALGVHQEESLRVGMDYVVADTQLEADESRSF